MNSTNNKLRGGYYTPQVISEFLAKWAIRNSNDRILEPSSGDGNILVECFKVLWGLGTPVSRIQQSLTGIEYYENEAQKARNRLQEFGLPVTTKNVQTGDFFQFCVRQLHQKPAYDVVIGNPPFIRYQDFPDDQKLVAIELMRINGLRTNRLANSWLAFLACSTMLLSKDGRLAMVIPAELFQVNYASQLRKYLSNFFKRIFIITFKKLVFHEVQQEVVLLLAERNGSDVEGIKVIELNDSRDLIDLEVKRIKKSELKPIDHNTDKWTKYFLEKDEILFLKQIVNGPKIKLAGELYEVDVGVVTGQNAFFVLSQQERDAFHLREHTRKIVTRSNHLDGLVFSERDFCGNVERDFPSFLFYPETEEHTNLPVSVEEYVKLGIRRNIHLGFKCRNRKFWFKVPSVWIPDAFMLRQVHAFPKLVINSTSATCTDTLHRVKFKNGFSQNMIAISFLNSLTFAFSEITGRSYGGGVLTFEPSEAERLPIPIVDSHAIDFSEIDLLLRKGGKIEQILNITDYYLLRVGLGLSKKETALLRRIWSKLRDRRISRKQIQRTLTTSSS
jgi:adenine-specific DNA-methyltransferase